MSNTKYYIRGTLTGSQSYETFTDDITASSLIQWSDEIEKFIEGEKAELAQYIDDRYACIQGVVTEIYTGVTIIDGEMHSLTEITATRELTEDEKDALCQYLTGQFSDGWGEGVEQREFTTEIVTEEEECYDEDEDYCYTEEYDVTTYLYLHFWQSEGFKLEFISNPDIDERKISDLECALDDELITHEEFEIAQNIKFNINGEDFGIFLDQIKKFMPLSDIKCVSYTEMDDRGFDGAYEVTLQDGKIKIFGWHDGKYGLEETIPKPKCKLVGADGNIFNLLGLARRALTRAGLREQAQEMLDRATKSESYDQALQIIMEYVEVE